MKIALWRLGTKNSWKKLNYYFSVHLLSFGVFNILSTKNTLQTIIMYDTKLVTLQNVSQT